MIPMKRPDWRKDHGYIKKDELLVEYIKNNSHGS